MSHDNTSGDRVAPVFLDYIGLALTLLSIEALGRRWWDDQPISFHWIAGAIFLGQAELLCG
jgi:hypothetical protein